MKLLDFNLLSEFEKMSVLRNSAVLIAERPNGSYKFELYQLFGFYVEQEVHNYHNVRKPYRTFTSLEYLDPYLGLIEIANAFQQSKERP